MPVNGYSVVTISNTIAEPAKNYARENELPLKKVVERALMEYLMKNKASSNSTVAMLTEIATIIAKYHATKPT